MQPDQLVSAIILIVVGVLQMSNQVAFPLWLVVVCLGVMIMSHR